MELKAGAAPAAVFDAFVKAIGRLEQILDRETAMLSGRAPVSFDDFNRKKTHGLLELRRAMDAIDGFGSQDLALDPGPFLAQLRERLRKNMGALQIHLDAAGAITAILARVVQEHESDGTYTAEAARRGKSRCGG